MAKKQTGKSRATAPRLRVLMGAMTAMGPGRADLLEAIERTGSISAAAREMKMSYRRAWVLVESTNAAFVAPLVAAAAGGKGGGGAEVTDFGRDILQRYRMMEYKATQAVSADFQDFRKLMVEDPPAEPIAGSSSGSETDADPEVTTAPR